MIDKVNVLMMVNQWGQVKAKYLVLADLLIDIDQPVAELGPRYLVDRSTWVR